MAEQWFYIWNGQQTGPCTPDQMRGMIQAGQIPPENPVWKEGMPDWYPVHTIPELAQYMQAYAPVPAQHGHIQSQLPTVQQGFMQSQLPPVQQGPYPGQGFPQQGYAPPVQGEDREEDEERAKKRRKKEKKRAFKGQMRAAAFGLTFLFWSIFLLLLAVVLFFLATGLMVTPDTARGAIIVAFACQITGFISNILFIAGSILCCFVPSKSGARPYILVSLGLVGAAFLMVIGVFVMALTAPSSGLPSYRSLAGLVLIALPIVAVICIIASYVLFMLFLRALAIFLGESGTANEVSDILWRWVVAFLLVIPVTLVAWGLAMTVGRLMGPIGALLFLVLFAVLYIAWIVFWIRQWLRLLQVIQALRKTMRYEFKV